VAELEWQEVRFSNVGDILRHTFSSADFPRVFLDASAQRVLVWKVLENRIRHFRIGFMVTE